MATQMVSSGVDLILANATPALQAAAAATSDIPILGTSVTEYGVALSIDGFNGTVGGNISGTSDLAPLDQQAAMFAELLPDAKTVGILYCSGEANSVYQADKVKTALEAAGVTVKVYTFADSNDVAAVTTTACGECDALYIPTDNTAASCTEAINNVAQPAGIPIICGEEGICKGCGIATLSIDYYELGRTTGEMAAKILTGEADISTMLDLLVSTLIQGLIYALVSFGVYITYSILDFPDLSVDGSFPLGAAVTAVLLTRGCNPYLTLLAAICVGALAGLCTGVIHVCGDLGAHTIAYFRGDINHYVSISGEFSRILHAGAVK